MSKRIKGVLLVGFWWGGAVFLASTIGLSDLPWFSWILIGGGGLTGLWMIATGKDID